MIPSKTHGQTDSQRAPNELEIKHAHLLDLIIQLQLYIYKIGGIASFEKTIHEMREQNVPIRDALTDPSNQYYHFCKGLEHIGVCYSEKPNIDSLTELAQNPVNEPILNIINQLDDIRLFSSLTLNINDNPSLEKQMDLIVSLFIFYSILVAHINFNEKDKKWDIDQPAIAARIEDWQQDMSQQNTDTENRIESQPSIDQTNTADTNTETVPEIPDEQPTQAQQEISKATVFKRETSESDLKIYTKLTNHSLIGKKNRNLFIAREELLSDEDINTAIELLDIKRFGPVVSNFTTHLQFMGRGYKQSSRDTWMNLGQALHFRRESHASDSPAAPYLVPFILANWDFNEGSQEQGGHWIALLIKITPTNDPANPQIVAECIDSMSSLSEKHIEYAVEQVIRYREVSSGKDKIQKIFQAFPDIKKENLTIKAINTSTQRDLWSCGYMALHTAFRTLVDQDFLPQATLNSKQLEFYNCTTSNEKRDFIYKLFNIEDALLRLNAYSNPGPETSFREGHYLPLDAQTSIDYYAPQIKYSAVKSSKSSEHPKVYLNTLFQTIKEQAKIAYDTFFLTVQVEYNYNLFIKTDPSDTVKNYMNALLAFLSREHNKSMLSASKNGASASKKDEKSKNTSRNTKPIKGVEGVAYYLNELIKAANALSDTREERQKAIQNISFVLREHILEKISDTAADIKVQGNYLHRLMRLINTDIPGTILNGVEPVKNSDYFHTWWEKDVERNEDLKLIQYHEQRKYYPSAIQVITARIKKLRLSAWQAEIANELLDSLKSDGKKHSKILTTIHDLSCRIIQQHRNLRHSLSKTLQDPLLQTLHYVEALVFTTSAPNTVRELLPYHLSIMIANFKELAKDTKLSAITDQQLTEAIQALTPIQSEDIPDHPQQREALIKKAYQSLRTVFSQFTIYNQALQATGKKIPKNLVPLLNYCSQGYQELGYIFSQCPTTLSADDSSERTYASMIENEIRQAENSTQKPPKKSKRTNALEKFGDTIIGLAADKQSMDTSDIDPSSSAETNSPQQQQPSAHSSSWLRLFMRPFYRFMEWVSQLFSTKSGAVDTTGEPTTATTPFDQLHKQPTSTESPPVIPANIRPLPKLAQEASSLEFPKRSNAGAVSSQHSPGGKSSEKLGFFRCRTTQTLVGLQQAEIELRETKNMTRSKSAGTL